MLGLPRAVELTDPNRAPEPAFVPNDEQQLARTAELLLEPPR